MVKRREKEFSIRDLSNQHIRELLTPQHANVQHPLEKWNTPLHSVDQANIANIIQDTQSLLAMLTPQLPDFQLRLQLRMLTMGDRLQYYLPERGTCVLCNMGIIKTSNHLFWECHFTKTVWRPIIEAWTNTFNQIPQWENVIIPSSIQIDTRSHQQPLENLQYAKQLWAILQVTISYTIWRARNDIVFNAHQSKPTPDTVRRWSLKCLWPQLYLWMDWQKNAPQSIFLKQFIQANAVFRVWWCNGYNLDKWIDSLLVVKTPHMPITCTQECRMQFDGGSLHNPGVAGSGWTIDIPAVDGELREYAWGYCYLGNNHSNNEAEYVALVSGLTAAAYLGYPIPLNRR